MEKNPLECITCEKELFSPRILPCLHSVCERCEVLHNANCPILAHHPGDDEEYVSTEDMLAAFLLKSAQERTDSCANCDKILHPMFYCETCQQYLCSPCKQSTHTAKMFERHIILKSEERSFVQSNAICKEHNESFVLYNEGEKRLACIKCFNDVQPDQKVHFVSLDHAYNNISEIIEMQSISLKNHQDCLQQELEFKKKELSEAYKTFTQEKESLSRLCDDIIDAVNTTKLSLTDRLESEQSEVEFNCRTQIEHIYSYLFPTKLCLMATRMLYSSSSRIDSLQLLPLLVKRTEMICSQSIKKTLPAKYCQSLHFRTELAKVVEPHIGLSAAWCPISAVKEGTKDSNGSSNSCITVGSPQHMNRPNVLPKFQAMIDLSGAFGQLFNRVEGPLKDVAIELSRLSIRAQEMQRDITKRRCLLKPEAINVLTKECQNLETTLGLHSHLMEELQPEMQELWQEQLDRVRRQQIVFREKANECVGLRCIARDVLNATKQLRPFAVCIEQMSSLIDPRRCHPPDPAPMESICLQISTIEPNSECRIAAIEKEEQNRRFVLEEKKKAEAADRELVRKALKHGKHRKKEQIRVMVNTSRERSPGGTDSTLFSPFTRKMSYPYRADSGSDSNEVFAHEFFDLRSEDDVSGVGMAICDQNHCSSSSLSLTITSADSPDQSLGTESLSRKTEGFLFSDDRDCRSYMLQSLHDVFAFQKNDSNPNDKNVLASVVKISQKKKKKKNPLSIVDSEEFSSINAITEPSLSVNISQDKHYKKGKSISQDASGYSSPELVVTSINMEKSDVPKVPYIPSQLFNIEHKTLDGFVAKEKVLKSLKERTQSKCT